MVGLKISSEEVSEIIKILGLSDSEPGFVYLNLLSLGMATLGQLSIVTGLDYIQTQEALNVLIGDNLVKRIPGKIGRYFALQPFLRALSLSYDPITLYNIRKDFNESYNEMNATLVKQNGEASKLFSSHTEGLINDFSTQFTPITQEYASIMDKHQKVISTSSETVQSVLEVVKSQIKDIMAGISRLFDKIQDTNEVEINNIPIMFQEYLPDIHKQLQLVQNQISRNLEELNNKTSFNIDKLSNSVDSEMTKQTESISSYLKEVQVFTEKSRSKIEEFTLETKSQFETLMNKVSVTKPRFKQISDRFSTIESDIDLVRSSLQGRIEAIEGLISETISDINARKMFRGKEEFIEKLKLIMEEKTSISNLLNGLKNNSIQLVKVSNDLVEIESNLVDAAEKGLKQSFDIFENRKNQYTELLTQLNDDISQKIGKELNNSMMDRKKIL